MPLSRRDRVNIVLLGFFFVMATTVELYFLLLHAQLPERAQTDFIARMFQTYAPADRAYFAPVSSLALALEGLNVFVTQPLGLVLIYGIVTRKRWRLPLQLAVGSYLSYSVILYFLDAHISGYVNMAPHSASSFAIFYGANAPWLLGYGWLALDAYLTLIAREPLSAAMPGVSVSLPSASAPPVEQRDRIAPVVEEVRE